MNAVPGSNTILNVSPPSKSLNLGHLSLPEKQCILNMYKQILIVALKMKITCVVHKICDTLGIAKTTIYRAIKEYRQKGELFSSKRCENRVRQIVHSFFNNNKVSTLAFAKYVLSIVI